VQGTTLRCGYTHLDCAAIYENEAEPGHSLPLNLGIHIKHHSRRSSPFSAYLSLWFVRISRQH